MQLDWPSFHRTALELSEKIRQKQRPWRKIVAVTRGGLFPAGIVARALELHLVDTVCIASYNNKVQGNVQVLKSLAESGKDYLVIDDLVDSGNTAQVIRQMMPHCTIATLFAKPQGRHYADIFVKEVPQDVWITFPWEAPLR